MLHPLVLALIPPLELIQMEKFVSNRQGVFKWVLVVFVLAE